MKRFKVVPDATNTVPPEKVEVCFECGVAAENGNILTPTQVKPLPYVDWPNDNECFYTLCMIDLDSPCPKKPTFRSWNHWLVGNIPGSDISAGDTIVEYVSSIPQKKTGLHRYVFLVYLQPCILLFEEKLIERTKMYSRKKFSIQKFARKYALGQPIAGNFFRAQWDSYVNEFYRKLPPF